MFDHVQCIYCICRLYVKPALEAYIELPLAGLRTLDHRGINVDAGKLSNHWPHQPRAEPIAASDLQNVIVAFKHLRHELVASQHEQHAARLMLPAVRCHQAHLLMQVGIEHVIRHTFPSLTAPASSKVACPQAAW